jgi:hypothetical protein
MNSSKETRARVAMEALRPDEQPLGSLTSKEQSWLATAFAHLNKLYENRGAGRPANNAVCVFDFGNIYVQFLAPWDAELLVCETVSAKSVPEVVAILTTEGNAALRRLGFEAPEISPNYSQTIKIEGVEDLAYAARLGFRVLKQVYRVADFGSGTFTENIPTRGAGTPDQDRPCADAELPGALMTIKIADQRILKAAMMFHRHGNLDSDLAALGAGAVFIKITDAFPDARDDLLVLCAALAGDLTAEMVQATIIETERVARDKANAR